MGTSRGAEGHVLLGTNLQPTLRESVNYYELLRAPHANQPRFAP